MVDTVRFALNAQSIHEIPIHEGPLPKDGKGMRGGKGMRAPGSERWCSLAHERARLRVLGKKLRTNCLAPYSRGMRKCIPHQIQSFGGAYESKQRYDV